GEGGNAVHRARLAMAEAVIGVRGRVARSAGRGQAVLGGVAQQDSALTSRLVGRGLELRSVKRERRANKVEARAIVKAGSVVSIRRYLPICLDSFHRRAKFR